MIISLLKRPLPNSYYLFRVETLSQNNTILKSVFDLRRIDNESIVHKILKEYVLLYLLYIAQNEVAIPYTMYVSLKHQTERNTIQQK